MGHHDHPHDHVSHAHDHVPRSAAGLRTAFILNLAFTLIEIAGGLWTRSIAVLTDALHDLGDCVVIGAAWYLLRISARGPDRHYSYGYGRYSMLGGWLAAGMLIIGSLVMIALSVPRFWEPVLPHTSGMMMMGVLGVIMNGIAAYSVHGGTSLNERGAYLHLLEDVLGWVAVLAGAVLMHFTGIAFIDPMLSIMIAVYILYNAIKTVKAGTRILMQAQPIDIDPQRIKAGLMTLPGVVDVHDQHAWSLDGEYMVHSVHLVIECAELRDALFTKNKARSMLEAMGIQHSTIELELKDEDCGLLHH